MLAGNRKIGITQYHHIDQVISATTLTEEEKCTIIAAIVARNPNDINKTYHAGNTALHLAAKFALPEVTKLLINLNFPINAQSDRGLTPLHCAAETSAAVVLLILCHQEKIEINLVDSKNETALHKAAHRKSAECLKILASQSALNILVRNTEGQTAQDIIEMDHDVMRRESALNALKALPFSNNSTSGFEQQIFENISMVADENVLKDLCKEFDELQLDHVSVRTVRPILNIGRKSAATLKSIMVMSNKTFKEKTHIPEDKDFLLGDIDKIDSFLKSGGDPNQIIAPHQRSLLYYAFIYKKKSLFIKLILAGASIKKHKLSESLCEVISSDEEGSHADFLLMMLEELCPIVTDELSIFDEKLQTLSDTVHKLFIANRFVKQFSSHEISQVEETLLDNDCMKALYFICCGMEQGSYRVFNSMYVSKSALGLLDQFSPDVILEAMLKLMPQINNAQNMICLYILKEILIYNVDFSYVLSVGFRRKMNDYLACSAEKDLQDSFLKFFDFIEHFKENSIFSRYHELKKMISFYPFKKMMFNSYMDFQQNVLFSNSAELLEGEIAHFALQMRNLSLQLFQICDLKEFRETVWEFGKTDRALKAPTIVAHEKILEKVKTYITAEISKKNSAQNRAKAFAFFVHAARRCLSLSDGVSADLCSVMTIMGGVNDCASSDLKAINAIVDKKTKKIYQQLNKLYNPQNNFRYARHLMRGHLFPIPFLPIFLKDKVMLGVNNSIENLSVMGGIYFPVLLLKRKIRASYNTFDTALLSQVGVKMDENLRAPSGVFIETNREENLTYDFKEKIDSAWGERESLLDNTMEKQKSEPITPVYSNRKNSHKVDSKLNQDSQAKKKAQNTKRLSKGL